ncbi:tape-measure protein [Streptomyces sp. NPDC051018]|uniref:tape-measure protein n=1 Tax=Streptomyces sp. NPDC051018 TaxID=3365639 RepID=UPI0037AB2DA4
MSAAMALPPDPLAGAGPAFQALRGQAGQATRALRQAASGIRRAAGGTGRLGPQARSAATAVRGFREQADAAANAAAKAGRSTAGGGVGRFSSAAARARAAVARLGSPMGAVLGLLVSMIDIAALVSGLMGTFGTVMTIASLVMTGVNTAMRANPLGFVLGILIPLGAYLIELAMSTETGRRIMRQVFAGVLQGFQRIGAFLGPVLRVMGSAVRTYFTAYRAVITGVLRALGGAIGGIGRTGSAVTAAAGALRAIASRAFDGLKGAVRPVQQWITDTVPGFFTRTKERVTGALRGIGGMLEGGMQTVLGVVKGPVNGLIAFANWIIDGLRKLSFSFFGKKFGVTLDKIPQLADGGVVLPGAPDRAPRILPLSDLEHRRVAPEPSGPRKPYVLKHFRETPDAGPRATAEDLLFLTTAHR